MATKKTIQKTLTLNQTSIALLEKLMSEIGEGQSSVIREALRALERERNRSKSDL